MSYHHTSQLWSSQFGVRFGALANLPESPSSSLHTSALGGDEGRTDSPVNPPQLSIFAPDIVQGPLPSFPRPRSPGRDPIALPPRSRSPGRAPLAFTQRSRSPGRPPIALPGLNVAAKDEDISKEGVKAPDAGKKVGNKVVEPPSTPLEFSISKKEFLAARAAIPGTIESHWSYTMYHRAREDGGVDNVKVHYCESKVTTERVCKEYFLNEEVIGLDLEWMMWAKRADGPRQNVSLIQIASPSRIALIHIAVFKEKEDFLGPTFRKIMENPNVSKVGVNITPDCTRLKNHLGVTVRGIFELSHLYKVVKYLPEQPNRVNKGLVSLAEQVRDQLLLPLYKGPVVRTGNWMRRLSSAQINYAASDAYAGLQLYYVLEEKRKALVPCPSRPYHAELRRPIPLPDPPAPPADGKMADEDATSAEPAAATSMDATTSEPPADPSLPKWIRDTKPRPIKLRDSTLNDSKSGDTKPDDTKHDDAKLDDAKPKAGRIKPLDKPKDPKSNTKSPRASASILQPAEASASGDSAPKPEQPTKIKSRPRPPKAPDTRDPRIIAAEAEMKAYSDEYTAANKTWPVTTPVRIRAYYIWYRNEDLNPADIAALLRDPPLLTSTVASYIVDAIQTEKFPYPVLRLHQEVVCHIDLEKPYLYKFKAFVEESTAAVAKMKKDEETKKGE